MPRRRKRKQKTGDKAANPGVFVRISGLGKGGVKLAQIVRGPEPLAPMDLEQFRADVRDLLRNEAPGATIQCRVVDGDDPRPDNVEPMPNSRVQRKGRSVHQGGSSECRLQEVRSNSDLQFDPHPTNDRGIARRLRVDNLKVTDRFLAVRPGAKFKTANMELAGYAPDVVRMGLHEERPDVNRNPYNFVPWVGPGPNKAQEPQKATHETIRNDRLSGRLEITFTARTPIFVPEGQLQQGDQGASNTMASTDNALDFFHCWNGKCDRYAIPGASVKGAVRSLFEALTNSRAGVTDDDALGRPPLYRRRATRLFLVESKPDANHDGLVVKCEYVWYRRNGQERRSKDYDSSVGNQTCLEEWRANLFWVTPEKHCHGSTLKYYKTNEFFALKMGTLKQYESMQKNGGHPHLKQHGGRDGNAANVPRRVYRDPVPEYLEIERELFAFDEGDLIFGIPNNGELQCFGKNVNFLWPGANSPLAMMGAPGCDGRGAFAALDPEKQAIDPAEATFGFVGKHGDNSHPFRGRVRFGTFWGPRVTKDKPPKLQLMPLTSPSGTKAKARPLYLEPASNGLSADYDGVAKLRGRKFYWHQQGTDGNIPGVHDLERMSADTPDAWREKIQSQLPPKIRPLPVGKQFTGTLHFTNLTEVELGALLVSIKPDLAYDWERPPASEKADSPTNSYGIKLGKGKPRGLGSVTARIQLKLATVPNKRYGCLDAPLATNKTDDATEYVEAYKAWCVEMHEREGADREWDAVKMAKVPRARRWNNLKMAKALKALLRIPAAPSVRVYPPQFAMYGWLPKLDHPDGAPTSPKKGPKAMVPAYNLKGP